MVILAIIALFLGVLYGLIGFDIELINYITNNVDYILYLLMFLVGINVGLNRGIVNKIKEYHIKIFIIPIGTIVGSILGGVICSFISAYAINECTAVASGLGWYSLSGVAVSKLAGAKLGSITFLSNLMREIFSFFCIPWIAKYLNNYSCIAMAGATSEDTTLPMLIRYTDEETVVLAVFNGVICSACVPFLIELCYRVF